jgi:DNA-binding MarR family transcriptional regulator
MPESALVAPVPDDDQTTEAALTVVRLLRAMERVDAGLTPHQYRVLRLVGAGGERSARLAERLAVAKPTLTSTADSLVAAGLLIRETETTDRRVVRLRLTAAGQEAVRHADTVYRQWLGELLDATGEPGRLLADFRLLDHALETQHQLWHARAAQSRQAAKADQLASPQPGEQGTLHKKKGIPAPDSQSSRAAT